MVQELFYQGLQDVDSDEAGVYNPYLGRSVQAFLFMDDTTLLARTKAKATPSGHVALYPASFVLLTNQTVQKCKLPELHRNRA